MKAAQLESEGVILNVYSVLSDTLDLKKEIHFMSRRPGLRRSLKRPLFTLHKKKAINNGDSKLVTQVISILFLKIKLNRKISLFKMDRS